MMPSSRIAWRRSSYSNGMGGECLEMATASGVVAVRDSKTPTGPQLTLSCTTWKNFIRSLPQTSEPG